MSAGDSLIYSTYLGGGDFERGRGIAVDSSENAYVTGYTSSTNFPLVSPYQAANQGGNDAFITKLSVAGSSLIYSTYLGGSGDDRFYGVAVDAAGAADLAGFTNSIDFPTLNAYQETYQGGGLTLLSLNCPAPVTA